MYRPLQSGLTVVVLLTVLGTTACGGSSGSTSPSTSASTAVATVGTGGGAANATRPAAPSTVPSPSAAVGGAAQTVTMSDANQFQPSTITVARGTTVTWVNTGQAVHSVTDDPSKAANPSDAVLPAGAQPWDSGNLGGGATFTHTFDTPGQYVYFCIPHEALGMVGRITVSG